MALQQLKIEVQKCNADGTLADGALLKLHRQYGKDESMQCLFTEISLLKFRIGELTSENEELKHALNKQKVAERRESKKADKSLKQYAKEIEKMHPLERSFPDGRFLRLYNHFKAAIARKNELQKEVIRWRDKYFQLSNSKL